MKVKPTDYSRFLYAEFDCERDKDHKMYPVIDGAEIPAGHTINFEKVYDVFIDRIDRFEKFRRYQTRRAVLYNRRFIIRISLDDSVLFDTETNLFENLRDKLKFNRSEGSRERFNSLLKYMFDIQFNPVGFGSDNIEDDNSIENHELSTFQKVKLLEGMSASKPRALASSYHSKGNWSSNEIAEVEIFVEKAIKKYGKKLLLRLLEMEKLPSQLNNAQRAFTFFDKKKHSSVRVSLDKSNEFVIEETPGQQSISIQRDGRKLHELKKDGSIKSYVVSERFDPTLALFVAFINDPLNQIIHFGAETKRCSFCNLPLEDPKSLVVGYGKKCAEINDLPWG